MTKIAPPFLEISFYFAETPDAAAFLRVLGALTRDGARFTGKGGIQRGPDFGHRPFGGISDELSAGGSLTSMEEAEAYATAADTRLIQVDLLDHNTVSSSPAEIVTYTSISDEAAATDHHPIAICSSGTPFDGPQDKHGLRQQRRLGLQVYKRFLHLIRQLQPSYAAITIEGALKSPTDLRRDPRSLAFHDFYVSTQYLGPRLTEQFHGLFPGAYREAVAEGWYISCWETFNPQGKNVTWKDSGEDSLTMAKLIGRAAM